MTLSTQISRARAARQKRECWHFLLLSFTLGLVFLLSLMFGRSYASPADIWAVLTGAEDAKASFTVGVLRLPRASLASATGFAFGMGGAAFQVMLRNPLASPDIIGISAGASTAAVFAIITLGWTGPSIAVFALMLGLLVSVAIVALSFKGGVSASRVILVGIGLAAILDSTTAYLLTDAFVWDLQTAMRWLTGSVNGARWQDLQLLISAIGVAAPALFFLSGPLFTLRLGDDIAASLGVSVALLRGAAMTFAIALVAFATATSGPIAFVAFLAGPICGLLFGVGRWHLLFAGTTGAILVLGADFFGQHALPSRYPVGVITGVVGAPALLFLLFRLNRQKGFQ